MTVCATVGLCGYSKACSLEKLQKSRSCNIQTQCCSAFLNSNICNILLAQDREEWMIWCKEPVSLHRTIQKRSTISALFNTCNRNEKQKNTSCNLTQIKNACSLIKQTCKMTAFLDVSGSKKLGDQYISGHRASEVGGPVPMVVACTHDHGYSETIQYLNYTVSLHIVFAQSISTVAFPLLRMHLQAYLYL